jgi:hypothetical protein
MNSRQMSAWLKKKGIKLNTLQELYALVLESNHGLEAVEAWLDGQAEYYDPVSRETVKLQQLAKEVTA